MAIPPCHPCTMLISFHLLRPWSLDADLQLRDAYRSIVVPDRYLNGHRHPPDQLPFVPTKNTSPTSHQTRTGHGTGPPVGPPVLRSQFHERRAPRHVPGLAFGSRSGNGSLPDFDGTPTSQRLEGCPLFRRDEWIETLRVLRNPVRMKHGGRPRSNLVADGKGLPHNFCTKTDLVLLEVICFSFPCR